MWTLLLPIVLLLAFAAWVSVDERVWPLARVSQPLLAGAVAGAILESPWAGLAGGLVFQLLWPALVPSGGHLLPSAGLGATAAGAIAAMGARLFGSPFAPSFGRCLLLAAALGVVVALAARTWEQRLRLRNEAREEQALLAADPGRALAHARRHAIFEAALRGWGTVGFAAAAAGFVFRAWLRSSATPGPTIWDTAGFLLLPAALGAGAGSLLRPLRAGRSGWIEIAVGLAAGLFLWRGLGTR